MLYKKFLSSLAVTSILFGSSLAFAKMVKEVEVSDNVSVSKEELNHLACTVSSETHSRHVSYILLLRLPQKT